jgi:hypothetical protein
MAKAFIESLCEGPLKLLENGIIGNLRGPDRFYAACERLATRF